MYSSRHSASWYLTGDSAQRGQGRGRTRRNTQVRGIEGWTPPKRKTSEVAVVEGLLVFSTFGRDERSSMPVKVNIVLDNDVKEEMDRMVPSGSRSRLINEALRKELLLIRRRQLSKRLDNLRSKTAPVSTREVVEALKRDRKRK